MLLSVRRMRWRSGGTRRRGIDRVQDDCRILHLDFGSKLGSHALPSSGGGCDMSCGIRHSCGPRRSALAPLDQRLCARCSCGSSGHDCPNRDRSQDLPWTKEPLGYSHADLHGAGDRARRPVSSLIREDGCQSPTLMPYLEACMASLSEEQVRVLFFNDACDAIADERIWNGTATEVKVPIGDLVRHAFACGSPTLLVAHNHPSGLAQPSRADVDYTRRLFKICKELEISVYDHIIVTRNGSFSFRERGYM